MASKTAKKTTKTKKTAEKIDITFGNEDDSNGTSFYSKEKKQTFIANEKTRLTKIFKDISADKKKLINSLIDELAFMFATLKDLKELIKRDGAVESYKNGANQYGKKKSAAVEVYNTMVKNYASINKQLVDLLPKSETPIDDGMDDFLNQR